MRFRFPTARSQSHPYLPRRRYTPPAYSVTHIPRLKKFIHDVLLNSDDTDIIPRGVCKAILQKEERIANMLEIDTSWDAEHVHQVIEGRFSGLIDVKQPFPR